MIFLYIEMKLLHYF